MKSVKRSALTLFLAVLSFVAAAHPHSFIRLQTQVVSENEQFVALKMRWTMDALTSAICCMTPETQRRIRNGKSWRRK